MVPTTALIESCWRQYAMRGGKVSYLRSGSGSIGIMQINQIVWRGFYQLERLRWDTAYNARAGAQILMRYVKDYAIPYAEKSGDPNQVPRAAYAVYNAGPRAVGRFDKEKKHPREAARRRAPVDALPGHRVRRPGRSAHLRCEYRRGLALKARAVSSSDAAEPVGSSQVDDATQHVRRRIRLPLGPPAQIVDIDVEDDR